MRCSRPRPGLRITRTTDLTHGEDPQTSRGQAPRSGSGASSCRLKRSDQVFRNRSGHARRLPDLAQTWFLSLRSGMTSAPFLCQAGLADKVDGVVLWYEVDAVRGRPQVGYVCGRLVDRPEDGTPADSSNDSSRPPTTKS
jgi:hypothetical protein